MRTTGIKPNLSLDRIRGLRVGEKRMQIPLKQEFVFPSQKISMKKGPNITKDGYKF